MKYLKITLRQEEGSSKLIYPKEYQKEIGNFAKDHLYYDGSLLLCVPDEDYKKSMVRTDVEEVSETEAKEISEANETETEKITDEAKIRRIEIKTRLLDIKVRRGMKILSGDEITDEELKALDPNDETTGIEKNKILSSRIKTWEKSQ